MLLQKPAPADPTQQFIDEEGNPLPGYYEKWSPRPDFAILLDGFPILVFEICSDPNQESDKYRMLLYAASILRASAALFPDPPRPAVSRSSRSRTTLDKFHPMVLACYIKDSVASVYILYLVEDGNKASILPRLLDSMAHLQY